MKACFENERRWVCYFTQPHREKLALASLRESGLEAYLPLYRKSVLRRGKPAQARVPLFPRYIFAASPQDATLFAASRLKGVTSFAARTLEQSLVCDSIISTLRGAHDEEGLVCFDSGRARSGQAVKVLSGPFAGFEGLFVEPDDKKRSFILLNLLGKTHRISVFNRALEVAA